MSIPIKDRFLKEPKPKYVGGGNFENQWLSKLLKIGVWRLRFCPPWNKEAEERAEPFLRVEQHQMFEDSQGKNRMPICLDFVMLDKRIVNYLAEKGKLTKEDFGKIRELGCPMCEVANRLQNKKASNEDKDYQKFASKTNYFWNVVQRFDKPEGDEDKKPSNKCYMWSTSAKIFNDVKGQVQARPLAFDPKKGSDFTINVTGEKLQRRYTGIAFYDEKTPLGLAKGEKIHNLDDALAYGVRTFDEIVDMVRRNHSTLVKKSGINLNDYM